ncbi:MAG TPA: LacI family DNA-binding transcriptional regulator [Candidatus Saccharimonadales bacterium]|nr:LacI family DNA-binding transcriptional regulator [Candidatus Saccharimonadales bacterium]
MSNAVPTLEDVAKLAGVSKSTASRILSAVKDARIPYSLETKTKVREAAIKLDYRPSKMARGLTMARTGIIGLVVPALTDAFFPVVISAIEAPLVKAGYSVILADSNGDSQVEQSRIHDLLTWQVDGLIVAPSQSTGHAGLFWELWRREIPFVTIDRTFPETPFCSVSTDDEAGVAMAVDHLAAAGRTRIAWAGGSWTTISTTRLRQAGYATGLIRNGILPNPEYALSLPASEAGGREAVQRIMALNPRPDAVICFSDNVALGLLEACLEYGIRVSEELAVIGYADLPFAGMLKTSLTTIRQPQALLGQRAVELLLKCMENKGHSEQIVLPVELIIRESTGAK